MVWGGERLQAGEALHQAKARDTVRVGVRARSWSGVTPGEWGKGRHSSESPCKPLPGQATPLFSLGALIWKMVTGGVTASWAAVGLW